MDPIFLVLFAAAVLAGFALAYARTARRSRGLELEPPPGKPAAGTRPAPRPVQPERPAPPAPPEAEQAATVPGEVAPGVPDLDAGLVAQVEEAMAAAEAAEAEAAEAQPLEPVPEPEPEVPAAPVKPRFRDRLGKVRALLGGSLGSVRGRDRIDASTWDDLEEALILADVGMATSTKILDRLRDRVKAEGITAPSQLLDALKDDLTTLLDTGDRSLRIDAGRTNVWLFVGVNGVGKTTTIGKVGLRQRGDGRKVVMAAGDTFRAAAADQLELWAKRVGADLVRGAEGGDPASIVFDAVQKAAASGADLVLADTAGRLHTKVNLMEELKKVRRVAEREPGHVSEVLLVIDATTGQNGLRQAQEFAQAVEVTGVVLTKLDGTAKGGIALAIQAELGIPIKLVGLGETADDLVDFDPREFVDAIFDADEDAAA